MHECEIMLGTAVAALATGENAVGALHAARTQLVSAAAKRPSRRISNAVERLGQITSSLTQTRLDDQTYAVVLKGNQVREALGLYRTEQMRLHSVYRDYRWRRFTPSYVLLQWITAEIVSVAFRYLTDATSFVVREGGALLDNPEHALIVLLAPVVAYRTYQWGVFELKRNLEYEWAHQSLVRDLEKLGAGRLKRPIVRTARLTLHADTVRELLAGDLSDGERHHIYDALTKPLVQFWWEMAQIMIKRIDIQKLIEGERHITVDHVLYTDKAGEPVWIWVFHSTPERKDGKRPWRERRAQSWSDQPGRAAPAF